MGKIGRKMANGRLLFQALYRTSKCYRTHVELKIIGTDLMYLYIYTLGIFLSSLNALYRVAVCEVISLQTVVLPGGKTMECLYGNGRKSALFLLAGPHWLLILTTSKCYL